MTKYFASCFVKPVEKIQGACSLGKILLIALLFSGPVNLFAWVYPEHRQIALLAIQQLHPAYRYELERLWAEARTGFEGRLTATAIDTLQGLKPTQLDYASWAAISGDHSCSPENLLNNVLKSGWILNVANIAAQLKADIAKAKTNSQHINAIRNADIRLQRADEAYATRASSSNVHFLLSRHDANTDFNTYIASCFAGGAELNALGVYAVFHTSALMKASKYATQLLPAAEKSALIMAALADEAFALHFLEDVYASGHIAGTWGNASLRKGTHDYYNEKGLEVISWSGVRTVNMGDAYMRNNDAEVAAASVGLSLQQLLDAAAGKLAVNDKSDIVNRPNDFNICTNTVMPAHSYDLALMQDIMKATPVPGLATGLGELPRFHAEVGKFWGFSASLNTSVLLRGFGSEQTDIGGQSGLEANVRFGFGLDGVLNQASDGLVFLQAGWRRDGASSNKIVNSDPAIPANTITSAIPGRSAYNIRLRLPFWLVPGDLLLAGPILLLTAPDKLKSMAVIAANGGLIPWQSGIASGIGRFQFVLGREVGVSFYGLNSPKEVLLIPTGNDKTYVLEYKSTRLDFPILEYRSQHNFSQDQSSSLMLQLNAGVDIPHHAKILLPVGESVPELKRVWYIGMRVMFNWRHYY